MVRHLYSPGRGLTIIRARPELPDPVALALQALGWVLSDSQRAERLLALTGMTPESLRGGLSDPAVLGACLEFLCNHEADLVAAAHALDIAPEHLVAARENLT